MLPPNGCNAPWLLGPLSLLPPRLQIPAGSAPVLDNQKELGFKQEWLHSEVKVHLSSQRDVHLSEGKQPFKIYLVPKLCRVLYFTNVGLLFQTNLIFNEIMNMHTTDLHNRAMTLPIFCNIPPSEGSSRGHVATLPAASLASAIQNSAHLVRINPQHVCEIH